MQPSEKSILDRKIPLWAIGGVLVLLVVVCMGTRPWVNKNEPGSDLDAKWVAQSLIEDWKRGNSGSRHWKDGIALQTLFAVRDYDHVNSGGWKREDGTVDPNRAWHRFRIKSSTKGGFPIELLWDINLEKVGTEWKVVLVNEAQPLRGVNP
jgi:hypothetical protein